MQKSSLLAIFIAIAASFNFAAVASATGVASAAEQQKDNRRVSGTVYDNEGQPIPGASVMIPGTTIGAVTDEAGRYAIEIPAKAKNLEFSFIGFQTQIITLSSSTVYDATLMIDQELLDEVVVVGYGVQKKVNLTGSVSAVNFDNLETMSRPVTDASQALQGASPGLQIMQGTGAPGSDNFSFNIRGTGTLNSSSPLVLVDGMEQSLSMVNPSDIASISVLKDAASCAIYGNRGANGVILVTTKNGGESGKVSVNYDATFSYNEPLKIIHTMSNYADYMELMNESSTNLGNSPLFAQSQIEAWRAAEKDPNGLSSTGYPNYVAYPNTDWWDVIYKKQWMQKHVVSVSGKEKSTGYTLSFGYTDNPGVVRNSGYKRYQGRVNLYSDIAKWLRVGARINGNVTDHDVSSIDGNGDGYFNSLNTTKMLPCTYPFYDGKYGAPENNADDPQSHNPLWDAAGSNGFDKRMRIYTDWYAQVKFLKYFTYNFDYYWSATSREKKTVGTSLGKYSFQADSWTTGAANPAEMYTYMYYTNDNLSKINHVLSYNQTFAKAHDVSAMLGYEEQKYRYRVTDMNKRVLTDPNVNDLNAASIPNQTTGYGTEWAARSLFGRANYAYKGKYLVEANFRYDGSSRFSKDYRWGFFPSFSAGWRISEEPWLKNTRKVDELKVRLSWGVLGNNSIGNYDWQALYNTANYSFGQSVTSGVAMTAINNIALQWEETAVANLGIDFGFLGNRLTGSVDAYNKLTTGILYRPDISMIFGTASSPMTNIAEVTNRGAEIELNWRDSVGDFSYSVKGTFAYNKNWVSKYKGKLERGWDGDTYKTNIGDVSTGGSTRVLEGHMINEWYLPNVYKGTGTYFDASNKVDPNGGPKDGMIRTPEDMKWLEAMQAAGYSFQPKNNVGKNGLWYGEYLLADSNGDKIYGNSYDYEFQGCSTQPKVNYGLQATAAWKGIDFSMNWGGSAGFKLYYYSTGRNGSETIYGYAIGQNVADDHYFFDPENPSDPRTNITSKQPRLVNASNSQSAAESALHLEKGDFLKLRNLTLGYTLPQNLTRKFYVQRLRFFFSGENLLLITGFSGQDPEMRRTVGYSTMRQYAIGANITF